MAQKPKKLLLKQMIMRRVLLALIPPLLAAVYFFGWRTFAMVLWAAVVGFATEYIFARWWKTPVSEAVFVTTTILALIMPPAVGWHVLTIAVIFAVAFGKCVFGGFGHNIFNPAMAGRCFVYVCFPIALTATWASPAQGPLGALNKWSTVTSQDAITSATPMANLKAGKLTRKDTPDAEKVQTIPFDIQEGQVKQIDDTTLLQGLLFGRISGTAGVTSALVLCIGGIYLFLTKTASRTIILTLIITYASLNQILYWLGVPPVPGAWPAVLGGGFLFGAFYMATDPISAPRTKQAKIIYCIIIATCTTVIRNFSIFNGGLMFSILIGNMFAPILDYAVKGHKARKKAHAEEAANA